MTTFDWRSRVRELWSALDRIQEHGFSLNPLDVLDNIAALRDLVAQLWHVVSEPPPGDPAAVEQAAAVWRTLGGALDARAGDLVTVRTGLDAVWHGDASDGCRRTVARLGVRFDDASPLAHRAAKALLAYADDLSAAQRRHTDAADGLRAARRRIEPCPPWEWPDLVHDVVRSVREAVDAATEAYSTAGRAADVCERELAIVADRMPFPPGAGAPGLSAFDLIQSHKQGAEERPLVGDTADRARRRYESMSAADRDEVDRLMAAMPDTKHRAWLLATIAAGADMTTLGRFADRIGQLDENQLGEALDPRESTLVQQSTTTCGSASLVYARMLTDPAYAMWVLNGYDPVTGKVDPANPPNEVVTPGGQTSADRAVADKAAADARSDRFRDEELAAKGRTNDIRNGDGGLAMPWPDVIGTSPWGAAEEMNGAAGVPGSGYGVRLVDSDSPDDRQAAFDDLARAADRGRVSPMYVGDEAIPRHVVLVIGRTDAGLQIYEPDGGGIVTVSESSFVSGGFDLGSWDRPWGTVTP